MRSAAVCVVAALVAACSTRGENPPADSPAASNPPTSTDTTAAGTPGGSSTWAVTPSGIGTVRVGMSGDELRQAAGDFAPPSATECAYVRPASLPQGASVMLASGVVARIDVDSAGIRTDAGIAVGDSSAAVMRAYDGRVSTTPHKYVAGGEYLTVRPAAPTDSTLRIVFEAESGRVTRYRSGRVPEVEWVERCG